MSDPEDLTRLIQSARADQEARRRLIDVIYQDLRPIAAGVLRRYPSGMRDSTTDLVHATVEKVLRRFPASPRDQGESRLTFYRSVAQAMREICRDQGRMARAKKRDPNANLPDPSNKGFVEDPSGRWGEYMDLDEAITRLESEQPELWSCLQLRFFVCLSRDEVAEVLGLTVKQVRVRTEKARAWLDSELRSNGSV